MKTFVIKDLRKDVYSRVCSHNTVGTKKFFAQLCIDQSKYKLVDIVGRGTKVLLEARYHNIRDKRGRFAKTRNR